jgi:hypothetical protein
MTKGPEPISLGWGALRPHTNAGGAVLSSVITTTGAQYFQI